MSLSSLKKDNIQEYWNVITHGIGIIIALVFTAILITKTGVTDENRKVFSALLLGLSSCLVYTTSTLYHYFWDKSYNKKLRTIDHISIYYLIAGTYTPFLWITFDAESGTRLLWIVWSMAILGTLFKLFFTGRFENISLAFYIIMGCVVFLELDTLISTTPDEAFPFVVMGGVLYLVGTVFYRWKSLPYNLSLIHI